MHCESPAPQETAPRREEPYVKLAAWDQAGSYRPLTVAGLLWREASVGDVTPAGLAPLPVAAISQCLFFPSCCGGHLLMERRATAAVRFVGPRENTLADIAGQTQAGMTANTGMAAGHLYVV